jgi:peptidoglycan hydrolase CwlO-like protein
VTVTPMRRNEAHKWITRDPIEENIMESRIARIESDVANTNLHMSEVRPDLKTANASIARLDVAVTAVAGQINTLEVKVAALDDKVDVLDAKVEKLDAKVDKLDAKITTANETLGGQISALSKDVANIQAMMKVGLWLLGGLGTLATVAKALHWI